MKKYYILLLLAVSLITHASYKTDSTREGWVTRGEASVPNIENMKNLKRFGGWLVITPDKDWEEKWNTPSQTIPHFSEASTVEYGQELTILTFFIHPLVDASGNVNITCGVKITRPDNTISTNQQNIECVKGELQGYPRNVRLSTMIIRYSGDKGDPVGEWIVEVNINDKNRGVPVFLKSSFILIESKANKRL